MADKNYFEFLDIPDGSGGSDRWHARDAEAQAGIAQVASAIGVDTDYEFVDLGLPSGTLWAKCNIGADSETGYGNYYMYGKGDRQYNSSDSAYSGTEKPLDPTKDTATVVLKNGAAFTNGTVSVGSTATLAVGESGTVKSGNLTLADGAALRFGWNGSVGCVEVTNSFVAAGTIGVAPAAPINATTLTNGPARVAVLKVKGTDAFTLDRFTRVPPIAWFGMVLVCAPLT